MGQLKSSDIDSEHSSPDKITRVIKSPIDKSKKVFTGLNFVLSYGKYKQIPMANDSDISSTENDTNLALNKNFFKPDILYKKYLETFISEHGGTCFKYLNLIPKSHHKLSYIITDAPSQTCNFILGLSFGIPVYHHKYIEQAVSKKIPFSEFLIRNKVKPLPNGWSVEKKSLVFRSPKTEHLKIFSDYIIYLALLEEPKNEFFAGILRVCGAIVYTTWQNGGCMPLTRHIVIVTDQDCPPILDYANVPKLSVAWVIQSLICESPRPFNGHESYIFQ